MIKVEKECATFKVDFKQVRQKSHNTEKPKVCVCGVLQRTFYNERGTTRRKLRNTNQTYTARNVQDEKEHTPPNTRTGKSHHSFQRNTFTDKVTSPSASVKWYIKKTDNEINTGKRRKHKNGVIFEFGHRLHHGHRSH